MVRFSLTNSFLGPNSLSVTGFLYDFPKNSNVPSPKGPIFVETLMRSGHLSSFIASLYPGSVGDIVTLVVITITLHLLLDSISHLRKGSFFVSLISLLVYLHHAVSGGIMFPQLSALCMRKCLPPVSSRHGQSKTNSTNNSKELAHQQILVVFLNFMVYQIG